MYLITKNLQPPLIKIFKLKCLTVECNLVKLQQMSSDIIKLEHVVGAWWIQLNIIESGTHFDYNLIIQTNSGTSTQINIFSFRQLILFYRLLWVASCPDLFEIWLAVTFVMESILLVWMNYFEWLLQTIKRVSRIGKHQMNLRPLTILYPISKSPPGPIVVDVKDVSLLFSM